MLRVRASMRSRVIDLVQASMAASSLGTRVLTSTAKLPFLTVRTPHPASPPPPQVIYGDTDSIMVYTASEDLGEVLRLGQVIKKEVWPTGRRALGAFCWPCAAPAGRSGRVVGRARRPCRLPVTPVAGLYWSSRSMRGPVCWKQHLPPTTPPPTHPPTHPPQQVNKRYRLLEIEMDGIYRRMLLLKKKKYAAVKVEPGPNGTSVEVVEQKGLDIVRRDWSPLCKDAGNAALGHILGGAPKEEAVAAIHDALREVRDKARELPPFSYALSCPRISTLAMGDKAQSRFLLFHSLVLLPCHSFSGPALPCLVRSRLLWRYTCLPACPPSINATCAGAGWLGAAGQVHHHQAAYQESERLPRRQVAAARAGRAAEAHGRQA